MPVKPPALTEAQTDTIVDQYDGGRGKTIPALAREYGVEPASVRYRLKLRGVLITGATMTESAPIEQQPDLSALADNPAVKAMLDQLVEARLGEMMAQIAPAPSAPANNGIDANLMSRMLEVFSMQQPGYQRPLAPDEMERRIAGKVEMDALLAQHKRDFERDRGHILPEWRVGEKGFFECVDAIELLEGATFSTYLPPVEDFEPLNDEARAVKKAMMQWLGGPTLDIGEQVKNAHIEAKRVIVPGAMAPSVNSGAMQNVTHAKDSSEPARPRKRQMGTLVEEPRQIIGGHASEPVGPVFESA